jgi:hypothetical protein
MSKQSDWAKEFVSSAEFKPFVEAFALGHNDALEWAANWIVNSATSNGSEAVIEFAANMAMSIRAAFLQKHP